MPCRVHSSDADLLVKAIRDISAGRLPCSSASQTRRGRGSGRTCVLCEQPVEPEESELETEIGNGSLNAVLHVGCYSVWLEALQSAREQSREPPHSKHPS